MQNIFVMHGHDGHDNVSKGAQNLICGHLDIWVLVSLDQLIKITLWAVLHDYKNTIAVAKVFVKLYDGWPLEYFQKSNFTVSRFFVLGVHIV